MILLLYPGITNVSNSQSEKGETLPSNSLDGNSNQRIFLIGKSAHIQESNKIISLKQTSKITRRRGILPTKFTVSTAFVIPGVVLFGIHLSFLCFILRVLMSCSAGKQTVRSLIGSRVSTNTKLQFFVDITLSLRAVWPNFYFSQLVIRCSFNFR